MPDASQDSKEQHADIHPAHSCIAHLTEATALGEATATPACAEYIEQALLLWSTGQVSLQTLATLCHWMAN